CFAIIPPRKGRSSCILSFSRMDWLVSFFFSSRRRHTSSKRDWSSDVCSSDLGLQLQQPKSLLDFHTIYASAFILSFKSLISSRYLAADSYSSSRIASCKRDCKISNCSC